MAKSHSIRKNTSFDSTREASWCNVLPDANENGKVRKQVVNTDALRTISRIVLAIQQRIDAGDNAGNNTQPCPVGTPGSSKTTGPNSGKNTNRGKAEGQ